MTATSDRARAITALTTSGIQGPWVEPFEALGDNEAVRVVDVRTAAGVPPTAAAWVTLSMLTALAGVGLVVFGATGTGTPAADASFLGTCDSDEHLPAPAVVLVVLGAVVLLASSFAPLRLVPP